MTLIFFGYSDRKRDSEIIKQKYNGLIHCTSEVDIRGFASEAG